MENIYIKNNNRMVKNLEIHNVELIRKGILKKKEALNYLKQEKKNETLKASLILPGSALFGTTMLLSDASLRSPICIIIGLCVTSFIISSIEYFKNINEINNEEKKIKKMSEKEHRIYQIEKIIKDKDERIRISKVDTSFLQEELNNYKIVLDELNKPKSLIKNR